MKRTVPLLIVFISGLLMIIGHFIPSADPWKKDVAVWFDILAAIAFVLGGGNLLKMNLQKISNQKEGWGYAAVILVAFVVTLVIGMIKLGSPPAEKMEQHGWSMAHLSLENFPQTFDIKGEMPEGKLPPVVKGQLIEQTKGELSFRGWMRSNQHAALKKFEMERYWYDHVAKLNKKAQPPESLKGRINFNAQLNSLTFQGVMSDKDKEVLLAMGANTEWRVAVKQLHALSNKIYLVPLDELPAGASIPEKLNNIVTFDREKKTLSLQGPMSNEQRETLLTIFPKAVALTDVEKKNVAQKLTSLGQLSESQKFKLSQYNLGASSEGERAKQLFFWLMTPSLKEENPQLNQAQKTYLLSQFNKQNAPWMGKVDELYVASHQTKYAWSGDYKAKGSGIWSVFRYGLVPLTATMFALLAFYVASAAFRAFRAKNIEATLLLGTAFIVLLGNTYAGTFLSVETPETLLGWTTPSWLHISTWKDYIMMVFNTAGNRAIMIGIALGIASTSLKVLLGIDRSYLGSD